MNKNNICKILVTIAVLIFLVAMVYAPAVLSAEKAKMKLSEKMQKKHPACALLLSPKKSRALSMGSFSFLRVLCSGNYENVKHKKEMPLRQTGSAKGPGPNAYMTALVNKRSDDFGNNTSQNTPVMAVDAQHSSLIYVFRDTGNYRMEPGDSKFGYAVSTDNGDTWTDKGSVPTLTSTQILYSDPSIACRPSSGDYHGYCYVAGMSCDPTSCAFDKVEVAITTDGGLTWSNEVNAVPFGTWDKPYIAVDNTGISPHDGYVYLVAIDYSVGGLIKFMRSTNGGLTWPGTPKVLDLGHDDCGDSGPVIQVASNGTIYVAWLHQGGCGAGLSPAIELVRSSDYGVSWSAVKTAATFTAPIGTTWVSFQCAYPSLNGYIGVTNYPAIGINPSNSSEVYAVFTEDPDGDNSTGDSGNVYFAKSSDSGDTWSSTVQLNDDAAQNDQYWPFMAVSSSGTILVGWSDKRNDTNNLDTDIYGTTSTDGGTNWSANFKIAPSSFPPAVNYDPNLALCDMGDFNSAVVNTGNSSWNVAYGANWVQMNSRYDQDVYFSKMQIASPLLQLDTYTLDDTGHNGNGNGRAEPGELIEFTVTLQNMGISTAHSITGTLSVLNSDQDKAVVITQNSLSFPDIAPGGTGSNVTPFLLSIYPTTNCGSTVTLLLNVDATEGPYTDAITLQIGQTNIVTLETQNWGNGSCSALPAGWQITSVNSYLWECSSDGYLFPTPYMIADSTVIPPPPPILLMDTELISDSMNATTFPQLFLSFDQAFIKDPAGDENADVDVKVGAGNWTNVARYNADSIGHQLIDLTSLAGSQSNVKVRYHYWNAQFNEFWGMDNFWTGRFNNVCALPNGGALQYSGQTVIDNGTPGNNDGNADPGEQNIKLRITLQNTGSADVTNISSVLTSDNTDAVVIQGNSAYPDITTSSPQQNSTDFVFNVSLSAICGDNLLFTLRLTTGPTGADVFSLPIKVPVGTTTIILLTADFNNGLPAGWTVTNATDTWKSFDSCLRNEFPTPFMIADSGCFHATMDVELITPVINANTADTFVLTFDHDFIKDFAGSEIGDVDVKIGSGGSWTNAASYDAESIGHQLIDLTSLAGNQSYVQIRFHYYDANDAFWWAIDNVKAATSPKCENFGPILDSCKATVSTGVIIPNQQPILTGGIKNSGFAAATSVTGTITTSDAINIIVADAVYPDISPGTTCTACTTCYQVTAPSSNRPQQHWDVHITEAPSCSTCTSNPKEYIYHIGDSFTDVSSTTNLFYLYIENMFHNEVTGGCTATQYCPNQNVQRQSMAKFICNAMNAVTPSSCVITTCAGTFTDVPSQNVFCPYIEELYNLGIVAGCNAIPLRYCPNDNVKRESMAKFICNAMTVATPGSCTIDTCGSIFTDVPPGNPFCPYIEALYNAGVISGCNASPLRYCPNDLVTRAQMAKFIVNGFQLQL